MAGTAPPPQPFPAEAGRGRTLQVLASWSCWDESTTEKPRPWALRAMVCVPSAEGKRREGGVGWRVARRQAARAPRKSGLPLRRLHRGQRASPGLGQEQPAWWKGLCRPGQASVWEWEAQGTLRALVLVCRCVREPNSQGPLGGTASPASDPCPLQLPPPSHTLRRPWLCPAHVSVALLGLCPSPPGASETLPSRCHALRLPALAAVPDSCRGRRGASHTLARPPGLGASCPVSSPGKGGGAWEPRPSCSLCLPPLRGPQWWPGPGGGPALEGDRGGSAAALGDGQASDLTHSRRQERPGRLPGGGAKLTLREELDLLTFSGTQQRGCWAGRAGSPWAWGVGGLRPTLQTAVSIKRARLVRTWRRSFRRLLPLRLVPVPHPFVSLALTDVSAKIPL